MMTTVEKARLEPFTTKSEFARVFANEIAVAACEGYISNCLSEGTYCNRWMVTQLGIEFLEEAINVISP